MHKSKLGNDREKWRSVAVCAVVETRKKGETTIMKCLSKAASAVMDRLTHGLSLGDHSKIDHSGGTFMPVCVENIGQTELGPLYSVAHYYEQNGDLMRDPEMVFLKRNGKYYPVSFQQDGGLGFYQEAIEIQGCRVLRYYPPILDEQASFAAMWMKNIREQQRLCSKRGEVLET